MTRSPDVAAGSLAPDSRDAPAPTAASELLAVICHDLRAPLSSIVMGAGFLQQSLAKLEGLTAEKRILQGVLRSSERMNTLIGDLHDLSHMETGRFAVAKQRVDVPALMTAAVEQHRALGEKKQVSLEATEAPPGLFIECDPARISQALGKLVDNAVRYSKSGATVTLSVSTADGRATFTVVDRGEGMATERLAHAFDHRWHSAQSPRDGTGLGLALVRGIAVAHGGDADVVSVLGEGTRVSFWLPLTT